MSKETINWDDDPYEFFENLSRDRAYQEKFSEIPYFSGHNLLNDFPLKITTTNEPLLIPYVGTRTNISEIEVAYPYLLQKEKVLKEELKTYEPSDGGLEASVIGRKLHFADTLFTIVLQGARGVAIKQVLPTAKDDIIEKFDTATHPVTASKIENEDDLLTRFYLAWTNFHNLRGFFNKKQNQTLPGFGLPNPKNEEDIFYSEEARACGAKLAEAWAKEYFRDKPMTWEFNPQNFTQREVVVGIKFSEPNIQLIGVMDSITRKLEDKSKGKVKSQIIDLKTGKIEKDPNTLAGEVAKRQKQLMLVMTERLTAKFIKGYKSLKAERRFFPMTADHRSRASIKRLDKAGYRVFNKETGEMKLQPFSMTLEERDDFEKWLTWYGSKINEHKQDVKKFIERKVSFDLNSYRIR